MTLPFERTGDGGENFGTMDEVIAKHFFDLLEENRVLVAPEFELIANVRTKEDGAVYFSDEQLESVDPDAESGTFLMRLKGTIVEHKKISGVVSIGVTGAALLGVYIRHRRKA